MLLSRWWAGLCSVLVWITTSSAELLWPTIQSVVGAPLGQTPHLVYLAGASGGLPVYLGHDYGNSISPSDGATIMNDITGFSARTGMAAEPSDAIEEDQDEATVAGSGRSPEASPRFITKFYEWYKGKEKEKEKEKEVNEDNDNYHVVISHHAAQTHHSDHHSSHHDDHHGHYGHRPGYGHGHYHHDHDHYHHDHGHGHDHHGHGHHGYGHHGSHSNIHIYGYPHHSYHSGHSPYLPYPVPYPYYPPAPHHHHQQPHPVVQPIIIGTGGGGGGGGGGKGKGKNKGKLVILNTSSTGGQVSTQGNYAAGYSYIS